MGEGCGTRDAVQCHPHGADRLFGPGTGRIGLSWAACLFQSGIPRTHEKMGYLAATFDLTEFCRNCGVGKKQIAPFQMRKDPGLKSTSMMQLNWVFDEFFTS